MKKVENIIWTLKQNYHVLVFSRKKDTVHRRTRLKLTTTRTMRPGIDAFWRGQEMDGLERQVKQESYERNGYQAILPFSFLVFPPSQNISYLTFFILILITCLIKKIRFLFKL
jgi:hypothetical protein